MEYNQPISFNCSHIEGFRLTILILVLDISISCVWIYDWYMNDVEIMKTVKDNFQNPYEAIVTGNS